MTTAMMNVAKFEMGRIVMTMDAKKSLLEASLKDRQDYIGEFILRHGSGDWGDMPEEDKKLNDSALANDDGRLMSSYKTADSTVYWVITEWDKLVTTLLLPEEY